MVEHSVLDSENLVLIGCSYFAESNSSIAGYGLRDHA